MKNIFKRAISVMLALLMMTGCISAFAAGETIDWYSNSVGEEDDFWMTFPCLGELTAGKNTVGKDQDEDDFDDDGSQECYSFTAESEGYYLFTFSDLSYHFNNYVYFSEDYVDGKAYGIIYDDYYQFKDDSLEFIYFLPAGETIALIQNIEEFTLTYEYLGEVTDVIYDETSLEGIVGADFYTEKDSAYGWGIRGEAVFSSEKTYSFVDNFDIEKGLVKGENTAELAFLGFKKEVTLKLFEAKDVIAKLEPKNLEDDLYVTEYYNGYLSADDIGEAELVITYADGRQETVNFDDGDAKITLPNGREYWIGVAFDRETLTAELYFAGEVYESYKLETVPAEADENLAYLHMQNSGRLEQANSELQWRLDHLESAETLAEKISLVFWIPGLYTNAFYQIFCNIVEFIEFYI